MQTRKYDNKNTLVRTILLARLMQSADNHEMTQEVKDENFKSAKGLRECWSHQPYERDELGFNLLHWAALCNQPQTVNELMSGEFKGVKQIDINATTAEVAQVHIRNLTALWIAAKHGYDTIVSFLLKNHADISITPDAYLDAKGMLLDKSHWMKAYSALEVAKFHEHPTVIKLLEQAALENYIKNRESTPEYKTTTSVLGLFSKSWGYSKTDKITAAKILQAELKSSDCNKESLENLKNTHPALTTSDLGSIYEASIYARKI